MGEEIKLTNGIVSAKSGFQGDITSYQISAPIQPGNSGGPVFYKDLVVGMIVAGNESGIKAIIGTSILKTDYILNCISNS